MSDRVASIQPASFESSNEPPLLGQALVKVYALTPGQTELQIRWPEDAMADTAETAQRRVSFIRFVQSELNTFLES